ncbi:MAG: LON peptidase substrate-binding domain-containing protein [Verrucomicrobiota bacterium]
MPEFPQSEPLPTIEIPLSAPAIILPETNLLPHGLLPLFIFEPRYRAMLRDSLESDRLLCVAMRQPSREEKPESESVFQTSGIGFIRASVLHDDGTSHLVLQGVRRVQFLEWSMEKEYPYATIKPVDPVPVDPLKGEALRKSTLALLNQLVLPADRSSSAFKTALSSVSDLDTLSDMIGHNIISNPFTRQHLLECPDPCERLAFIQRHLKSLAQENPPA